MGCFTFIQAFGLSLLGLIVGDPKPMTALIEYMSSNGKKKDPESTEDEKE